MSCVNDKETICGGSGFFCNQDKLYLIRPILDSVLAACLNSYLPHRDVAVDEAKIKFRGALCFRQYMPAKPTKYGIKVWARGNSYVSDFEVYVGRPAGGQWGG